MSTEDIVRKSFLDQAMWCGKLGSPFMERMMHLLGERLDFSTESGSRILNWQGVPDATGDAVGLRLAGALHALVRRGDLPTLKPLYHNHGKFTDEEMVSGLLSAVSEKDEAIFHWLAHSPQTNEVRRASIIYAALLELVSKINLPIALYELGASGGLNLQMADFSYEFAGEKYGRTGSEVRLLPEWQGPVPPKHVINVVSRKGCDLNPLFVERENDCGRLMAYIWPDQSDRIKRTHAAIEIAKQDPPKLEAADAATWLEKVLENDSGDNTLRVIYHTIAWQYFPEESKSRIKQTIQSHGDASTSSTPIAWISFEMAENNKPVLALRLWPGGARHVLGTANAHVQWINWLDYRN